jgi:hypothetical protein
MAFGTTTRIHVVASFAFIQHPYVTLPVTSLCRLVVRLTLRPANQAHSPDLARR